MLRIESLSAHYGAIHAVKGVSVDAAEGEIVTIVGPNGAGKTTLLRVSLGPLSAIARFQRRRSPLALGPTHVRCYC
jgi:branched-chain amino acid transport system ATP-binding protein